MVLSFTLCYWELGEAAKIQIPVDPNPQKDMNNIRTKLRVFNGLSLISHNLKKNPQWFIIYANIVRYREESVSR
jgi:hypothetical protein